MQPALQPQAMTLPGPPPRGEIVLSARNLGKVFGGFTAVQDVNLDVYDRSIHALIGPNGAGKTTAFNLLTKFLQPTTGRIQLLGEDITHARPNHIARMGMVRSFQISAIFPDLTVLENIRIALQRPGGLSVQFWRSHRRLDRLNDRAAELAAMMGLTPLLHTRAASLSYGRKRVLELATTLALDPKVLLLDEPLAGMGREDIETVAAIIRRIGTERAVLMVEHNLNVVADICNEVTVLQRGRIIAHGSFAEVSADPQVRTAYLGDDA